MEYIYGLFFFFFLHGILHIFNFIKNKKNNNSSQLGGLYNEVKKKKKLKIILQP